MTLLERYRGGNHKVWDQLASIGEAWPSDHMRTQAWDVAREIADRCLRNLRRIRAVLMDSGYDFYRPDSCLVETSDDDLTALAELEASQGSVPLIVKAWYQRIASTDFRQTFEQFRGEGGHASHTLAGLGWNPVLVYLRVGEALQFRQELLSEGRGLDGGTETNEEDGPTSEGAADSVSRFFLPLGGWASNCEPKGFYLPTSSADAIIFNDGGGGTTFVGELRSAFKWGGFPSWSRLIWGKHISPRIWAPKPTPAFREIYPKLIDGLEPI